MNKARLSIVADDFGISAGVNRAVIEAHRCGTLPSASLAATGVAAEEAFALASATPSLELGIHVVLAAGRPCSDLDQVPSLLDSSGRFVSRATLFRRAITGRLSEAEVVTEVAEQLSRFAQHDRRPAFINGDQHVQVLPLVRNVLLRYARENAIPLRVPAERVIFFRGPLRASTVTRFGAKVALNLSARRLGKRLAYDAGNERLISPFGLFPSPRFDLAAFTALLDHVTDGLVELMVHPAYPDKELAEFWTTGERDVQLRKQELEVLLNPRFQELLRERNIVLRKVSERHARA